VADSLPPAKNHCFLHMPQSTFCWPSLDRGLQPGGKSNQEGVEVWVLRRTWLLALEGLMAQHLWLREPALCGRRRCASCFQAVVDVTRGWERRGRRSRAFSGGWSEGRESREKGESWAVWAVGEVARWLCRTISRTSGGGQLRN
jgi:hypothetical protein